MFYALETVWRGFGYCLNSFPGAGCMGRMGYYGYDGGLWMFFIFKILFWVLILGAIIYLVSYLRKSYLAPVASGSVAVQTQTTPSGRESAQEALRILNERYARGEIDDERYRIMKQNFTGEAEDSN